MFEAFRSLRDVVRLNQPLHLTAAALRLFRVYRLTGLGQNGTSDGQLAEIGGRIQSGGFDFR